MAKRISEWTLDDCLEFVRKIAKVNIEKNSEGNAEVVCEAFRSNNIHGSSLSQLTDRIWRELVPNLGDRTSNGNSEKNNSGVSTKFHGWSSQP
jgi:hypothetical protein